MRMVAWKIGPTWQAECVAAGIAGDGWSWDIMTGEFQFNDGVPQAMRDAIAVVYAAHDPAAQTVPPTPYPPGTVSTTTWKIPRLQVINRLAATNKFAAFMDALDDSTQLKRELWLAMDEVPNDTAFVIELLTEAGADPAVILARVAG
jgi:hypothetical protein